MSNVVTEVEVSKYLKITKFNRLALLILNLAILASSIWGYTSDAETAGLFFISIIIYSLFLKMATNHVKHDAITTGYISKGSSIFDILNKFSEDIKGSPEERMEYRKKHSLLSARLDATATLTAWLSLTVVFWLIFIIKALF